MNNDTLIDNERIKQGICPTGWHVPSRAEFNTLSNNATGLELKSSSGWNVWTGSQYTPAHNGNGTNDFGFNGAPCRIANTGSSVHTCYWWGSTLEYKRQRNDVIFLEAYELFLSWSSDEIRIQSAISAFLKPLRCLKDN